MQQYLANQSSEEDGNNTIITISLEIRPLAALQPLHSHIYFRRTQKCRKSVPRHPFAITSYSITLII